MAKRPQKGKEKRPQIQKRSKEGFSSRQATKEFDTRSDKVNEAQWYASKTQELKMAAITNFLVRAGRKSDFGIDDIKNHSFPGIMSIFASPAYGMNKSKVDPATICAQNLYTYVRAANSGARNYDSIDLFIYYAAVTQIYSWLAYVKRALQALDKYAPENQYVPEALVRAMNFDYSDLRANQAQLEIYFNNAVTRVSSLAIPGDIDAIKRAIQIYENVYWDDSSVQSQMYVINPRNILKYALVDDAGALIPVTVGARDTLCHFFNGYLDTTEPENMDFAWTMDAPNSGAGLRYADIVDVTEQLISAVFYDQDVAIMSGDVLKAYGKEALFKFAPYDRAEVWNPVYDPVALSMIENATLTGPLQDVKLTQDETKSYLIYNPHVDIVDYLRPVYNGKRMLNFFLLLDKMKYFGKGMVK